MCVSQLRVVNLASDSNRGQHAELSRSVGFARNQAAATRKLLEYASGHHAAQRLQAVVRGRVVRRGAFKKAAQAILRRPRREPDEDDALALDLSVIAVVVTVPSWTMCVVIMNAFCVRAASTADGAETTVALTAQQAKSLISLLGTTLLLAAAGTSEPTLLIIAVAIVVAVVCLHSLIYRSACRPSPSRQGRLVEQQEGQQAAEERHAPDDVEHGLV